VDERLRVRFEAIPAALRAALGRDCALVVHCDRVDEVRYDIFEIQRHRDGITLTRQCWWYDDDTDTWSLDETSEWLLEPDHAMQLGVALQQAAMPAARRSGRA